MCRGPTRKVSIHGGLGSHAPSAGCRVHAWRRDAHIGTARLSMPALLEPCSTKHVGGTHLRDARDMQLLQPPFRPRTPREPPRPLKGVAGTRGNGELAGRPLRSRAAGSDAQSALSRAPMHSQPSLAVFRLARYFAAHFSCSKRCRGGVDAVLTRC